jgi:hypothetical protein
MEKFVVAINFLRHREGRVNRNRLLPLKDPVAGGQPVVLRLQRFQERRVKLTLLNIPGMWVFFPIMVNEHALTFHLPLGNHSLCTSQRWQGILVQWSPNWPKENPDCRAVCRTLWNPSWIIGHQTRRVWLGRRLWAWSFRRVSSPRHTNPSQVWQSHTGKRHCYSQSRGICSQHTSYLSCLCPWRTWSLRVRVLCGNRMGQ